jgi:hypothetical protein
MIDLGAAKEETTRSQYIENLVEAAAIWSFCKKSANSVSRTFFVGIRKSVASMRNMNKTARVAESGSLRRRSRRTFFDEGFRVKGSASIPLAASR